MCSWSVRPSLYILSCDAVVSMLGLCADIAHRSKRKVYYWSCIYIKDHTNCTLRVPVCAVQCRLAFVSRDSAFCNSSHVDWLARRLAIFHSCPVSGMLRCGLQACSKTSSQSTLSQHQPPTMHRGSIVALFFHVSCDHNFASQLAFATGRLPSYNSP